MTLPESIRHDIESETGLRIRLVERVSGGDISSAARVTMADGASFFAKWDAAVGPLTSVQPGAMLGPGAEVRQGATLQSGTTLQPGGRTSDGASSVSLYECEMAGLRLLRKVVGDLGFESTLHVPQPVACSPDYLLLEWLERGASTPASSRAFGRSLAMLHSAGSAITDGRFGLDHDNWIGSLPQSNRMWPTWGAFYVHERILPQLRLLVGERRPAPDPELDGILERIDAQQDSAIESVNGWFPHEAPSLLHGDLWAGNWMALSDGRTALIDPAVHLGHREMDLAMSRLFGGFDAEFYLGYEDVWPLDPGAAERVSLCQLYPLLVHANLFGGSYVNRSVAIVREWFGNLFSGA